MTSDDFTTRQREILADLAGPFIGEGPDSDVRAEAVGLVVALLQATTDGEAFALGEGLRGAGFPPDLGALHDRLQVELILLQSEFIAGVHRGAPPGTERRQ